MNAVENRRLRNIYLDVVKGIAMFLVIWGHCIQYFTASSTHYENIVFKVIYSFHMPLFALILQYCIEFMKKAKNIYRFMFG